MAMTQRKLSIAIIGAGMGGLTAAATLRRVGIDAQIYEQAAKFHRLGAGIQMTPNPMKVLRAIGLESALRRAAFQPRTNLSRDWDSGAITSEYALGQVYDDRYGAPHLLMHRGDLHALLAATVPEEIVHRGKQLVGFDQSAHGITLAFADGSGANADALIGADGVHSTVREQLLGAEAPRYTGRVAYRTTFPAALLKGLMIDDCTKWWGPDRHIVIYYVTAQKDEIYFTTSTPEPAWSRESWSAKGDLDELRAAYDGFHPDVRAVLLACPEVYKWAIFERDPLPRWGEGRVVLLGDACHPMTPYMAQGAATAMEDAAILSRCLAGVDTDGVAAALRQYEACRKERTARIQAVSHQNTWMHKQTDPDWVYGYDAWTVPLARENARV
jgi:salicylate hydroxylase/6-hydroxynicotinate 3-monooxygenase